MVQLIDLPLSLDRSAPEPLVPQLAGQLRDAIHAGLLRAGDALPSSRTLATTLGVSRGTVTAAYDQLTGEGYLEARAGAATRVRELAGQGAAAMRSSSVRSSSVPLAGGAREAAAAARGIAPHPSEQPAPPIDLTPGHPSSRGLVDPAWRAAWRAAVSADPGPYPPPVAGETELRVAIAEHLRRARGLDCAPEEVFVTAGTSDALLLLGLTLRTRHEHPLIAVENPGYPTARNVLQLAGARLSPIDTTADGLRVDALERLDPAPDAVVVTPSHQYPSGGRLPVQQRLRLLAWAEASGALVIEDDYDSEFRHEGMPLPALTSLDRAGHAVLVGSFSKVLTPALRAGYIVARGEWRDALFTVRESMGTPVAGPLQLMLARYIGSGGLARHISRRRREYAHRRALVISRLDQLAGIRLRALDGGLHAVVETPDAAAVVRRLATRGVLVADLAEYDVTGDARGFVIGYGAPTDLELDRALDVITEVLSAR